MAAAIGPVNFHADAADMPALDGFAVTPSDSVNHPTIARWLWVGTTGNVAVVFPSGNVVTLTSVPTGTLLRVSSIRINSTNTTASNMVGLI